MKRSRIRVKMCGMTRKNDIEHAIDLGVDAIGLIFFAKSSRHVSIKQAKELIKDIAPFVDAVAVLVNPEREFVQSIIEELPVQLLQFHGDETPEFCQQFGKPFVKAMHPKSKEHINDYAHLYENAQALLLDAATETSRGGTGLTFDWSIIPDNPVKPYILAGGLNESNVADAVKRCNPYAVDVCSGIETAPGVKDHNKMNQFIKAIWGI